jgi:hypothetical protein
MAQLRSGATESGYQYSIENMVRNFRRGILECLATTAGRPFLARNLAQPVPTATPASSVTNDFPGGQS